MPKPLPEPRKDSYYVGPGISFFGPLRKDSGICDWCDIEAILFEYSGNDEIKVSICKECEKVARRLSRGGWSMLRSDVEKVQIIRRNKLSLKKSVEVE